MFALLTGNGKRAPDYLKEYYTLFCESTTLDYEEVHKKIYVMEEKSSKFTSKEYVYRRLKELPFTAAMNRRKFSSLLEETLQSSNSSKAFVQGRKLSQLSPQQVSIVQKIINTVKSRIQDGTFTPAKYTDKRGYRFFFDCTHIFISYQIRTDRCSSFLEVGEAIRNTKLPETDEK
ncbi:hypothetical protein INT47_001376 [Mucor saturninus]|uniref:Uncharacterized protein n=1 Tax=Mucor saturninus TaxID=64648 RepID=A0A8H7QYZ9_9FUNG|nr:hypothetical protein INT47_001376 [Mucor saturninus]